MGEPVNKPDLQSQVPPDNIIDDTISDLRDQTGYETSNPPNGRKSGSPQKSLLLPVLGALSLLLGLGGGGGWLWWQGATAPMQAVQANQANAPKPTVQIEIPPGTASEAVGEKLLQAGLIRSMPAWKLWLRWKGLQDSKGGLQAGSFALSPQDSLDAVGTKIWNGEVITAQFTIPEGWSIKQMADYFQAQGYFPAQKFLQASRTIPRQKYAWLPAQITSLEGFLYPNTYSIPAGTITPEQVIDMMLNQFQQVALPLYQQQKQTSPVAQKLSLLEWVTLSSIVEKEAVIAQERPLIAGVFWNRLLQNIALGSDPTVEYGLGIRQTADQPLTFAQVNTPSPYNTYQNVGLPPGPIASPASASFKATLNPTKTDYLYFVARYDGTHVFSRTLKEHLAAQDRIHDQREQQSAPTPSPGASP
jgi:UPF0755 protein